MYRLINIRAEASLDAEILGQVKQGETYDVLGYTVDEEYEWYQIEKMESKDMSDLRRMLLMSKRLGRLKSLISN